MPFRDPMRRKSLRFRASHLRNGNPSLNISMISARTSTFATWNRSGDSGPDGEAAGREVLLGLADGVLAEVENRRREHGIGTRNQAGG